MAHIPALDQYNITRWDDVEIVAESNGPCSRSTVTIAFAARTVIHTSASDSKPGCLWPNEKPRVEVVKLVDGMEWAMKHEQIDNAARRKIIRISEAVRVKSGIFWSTESRPN